MYAYTNKFSTVELATSPSAYGEIMTVEVTPVMQYDFIYGVNGEIFNTSSLSGQVETVDSNLCLKCSGSVGSFAEIKTKRVLRYRPGQGNGIRFTSFFTTGSSGTTQIYGIGDDNDGLFVGMLNDKFGILRRSFGVDHWTLQEDFNLDKLDGSAGSAFTYNPEKGNVFDLQYQWLGYGAITFNIESEQTGKFIPFHRINYTNKNVFPSTQYASNPILARVQCDANTGIPLILRGASVMAYLEGTPVYTGPSFSVNSSVASFSSTTQTNIITLKNKTIFRGINNKIPSKTRIITLSTEGNKPLTIDLTKNASLSGTPVYNDKSVDSTIEYTTSSSTLSGGTLVASFTLSKSGQLFIREQDLELFMSPGETLTLSAATTSGGTNDVAMTISWVEDH